MKLSEELERRGFVHQFSSESLAEITDGEKRVVYHGIDPTADSAHAGNFVNWILLRHFVNHGHTVVFLVGGGTGRIGDPKPDAERTLTSSDEVDARVVKLKAQAEHLLGTSEVVFVNNNDWLSSINLIDFLRDTGKHFTVGELIKKDAIATRLASDVGLSYTEFAYPLLQAYDYLQLHQKHGADVQVGGSDQWGNIIAGVDLVRRVAKQTVYALTQPLVIDKATGKKFGKSEGNAVWLDSEKTSPYQFYQFWLNSSDEDVIDYLKRFTFIALDEISEVETELGDNPGARNAQQRLAREVTRFVHGAETTTAVEKISGLLFGEGAVSELTASERAILLANAPGCDVASGALVIDVLMASLLAGSKREARTFVESGAVTLNGTKISEVVKVLDGSDFYDGVAILKRGKKKLVVLRLG